MCLEENAIARPQIAVAAAMVGLWLAGATVDAVAGNAPPVNQHRPQEEAIAASPLPYREEPVMFGNPAAPAVQLAGTLTLPPGAEPAATHRSETDRSGPERFPAIVMIAGSGRHDRNEEFGEGHKPLLVLADALTRQGFAVLRYDKRGIGKSTGDYASATTPDFASDVTAAIGYLRSRPDIDIAKVGLIGHSEGGTIAAIVAAKDPGLAFIVMMAPAALPGGVLVAEQNRRMRMADGETKEAATQTYKLERRLYAAIAASKDQSEAEARVKALLASARPKPAEAESHQVLHFTELPYMRFILAYDPTPVLRAVRVPALALNGSKDLICPSDLNIPALRKALAHDRDVTVVEVPGLNHFFQHAATGSPREFAKIEETLAPEVLSLMEQWIMAHSGRPNTPAANTPAAIAPQRRILQHRRARRFAPCLHILSSAAGTPA